jgi:hypothetical protein
MKFLNENIQEENLGRLIEQDEQSRRKVLVEAWKKTGYLYGLKGRDVGNMSVLMENQKKQILKENNTTADMAVFDTIAIPMIRRQNALMVSPNLISVQPLSYPHGLVFYLDYKVSNTKKPIRSDYLTNDGTGGQADDMKGNTYSSTSGYDQFYDNANYDLSKGRVIPRGWNPATSNFVNTSIGGPSDAGNSAAFSATADLGATTAKIAIVEFDLSSIGGITMDQAASIRVYDAAGTLVQDRDFFVQRVPQNYTDDIMSSGRAANTLDDAGTTTFSEATTSTYGRAGGPGNVNNKLRLRIIPTRDALGASIGLRLSFKTYLNLELFPAFSSELKLEIVQVPITTQIHKLKTSWTVELAQDLMAYYAIDAEAELSQLLAEQIAGEKDRMIIRELATLAGHFEVWNADFYNAVDPNPANTVYRGLESGYNQGLVFAINRIDGKIRKSTRQGGANWILISAEGATKLVNLDTFKAFDHDEMGTKFAVGVEKIGTLESKYQVYVDPNLPAHICLIGRKGSTFFDTGYVYAPYIEYILSPTVIEDQDFNPRKMISSRFGTKMLNNRFYGVVYLQGLSSFEPVQPALVNNA